MVDRMVLPAGTGLSIAGPIGLCFLAVLAGSVRPLPGGRFFKGGEQASVAPETPAWLVHVGHVWKGLIPCPKPRS